MRELVPRVKELWATRREEAVRSAAQITASLRNSVAEAPGEDPGEQLLHDAFAELAARFDTENGGFGDAPKFPTPHNLVFLIRYHHRTGNAEALGMVEKTLQSMRRGGMYDHVGLGFHRYSTDARWLVPHFEKMLYDQALLATAYTEAFRATGKDEYAAAAREVLTYVLRDMAAPEGGFHSAEDADSEGEEGRFYLWTVDEVREAVGTGDAGLAIDVFNLEDGGNFTGEVTGERDGRNILHVTNSMDDIAAKWNIPVPELRERLEAIRRKLYDYREKRVRPGRDDKVLTDWNGLMIAALARAAWVFDEPDYAVAAGRAAGFILGTLRTADGRLLHRYRDGEAGLAATIDDYAFFIDGLLELYAATFDTAYLEAAINLNEDAVRHFRDEATGGFYFTADDSEGLLVRRKEVYDGAVPSGNSVAMLNLLRLAHITGDTGPADIARGIGRAFSGTVAQMPYAFTQFLVAVDFAVGPVSDVVIAGDARAAATKRLLAAVRALYVPRAVVLLRPASGASVMDGIAPFTREYTTVDGKATAYVCRDFRCSLPATDAAAMLDRLRSETRLR